MSLRELAVYLVVAMSSLFLTAYTVHMLVGGLVSPDTEYTLMGVMCLVVGGVIALMARDVYRRRKGR
ncbi:MAG: hypothetical protein KGL63_14050 [Betaproteobacteria bacterium]|nr:hypothetical protein [Betaproteobacteria bacterium]